MSENPFPESLQKAYLRRIHLNTLAEYKSRLNRSLNYFGLPSAEMLDVKLWKPVLGQITAIENDENVAKSMYSTAHILGIRDRTNILEMDLSDVMRLLSLDERDSRPALAELALAEETRLAKARTIPHDIFNMDFCGSFVYLDNLGQSKHAGIFQNMIKVQARQRNPFFLFITFDTHDYGQGASTYDQFIKDALDELEKLKVDVSEARSFYSSRGSVNQQSQQLRRFRFCIPLYLLKIGLDSFTIRCLGSWYYKTFYHVALFFDPRKGKSALGLTWPPIDEVKEILQTPLYDLEVDTTEEIQETELLAPQIP